MVRHQQAYGSDSSRYEAAGPRRRTCDGDGNADSGKDGRAQGQHGVSSDPPGVHLRRLQAKRDQLMHVSMQCCAVSSYCHEYGFVSGQRNRWLAY